MSNTTEHWEATNEFQWGYKDIVIDEFTVKIEKVLQQKWKYVNTGRPRASDEAKEEWRDVPTVNE